MDICSNMEVKERLIVAFVVFSIAFGYYEHAQALCVANVCTQDHFDTTEEEATTEVRVHAEVWSANNVDLVQSAVSGQQIQEAVIPSVSDSNGGLIVDAFSEGGSSLADIVQSVRAENTTAVGQESAAEQSTQDVIASSQAVSNALESVLVHSEGGDSSAWVTQVTGSDNTTQVLENAEAPLSNQEASIDADAESNALGEVAIESLYGSAQATVHQGTTSNNIIQVKQEALADQSSNQRVTVTPFAAAASWLQISANAQSVLEEE